MKALLTLFLVLVGCSLLQAQENMTMQAKVKKWLKEKQLSFYAKKASDPSIKRLLVLYDQLNETGILCPPQPASPEVLKVEALRTNEDVVHISWEAVTGKQVAGYALERSFEKNGFYKRLHYFSLSGGEPGIQNFRHFDNNPFTGKTYYRVVQVTTEGRSTEKKATAEGTDLDLIIKAVPNPTNHHFRVSVQSRLQEPLQVRVVDVLGRVVEHQTNRPANSLLELGSAYRAGIYIIQVTQGNKTRQLVVEKSS